MAHKFHGGDLGKGHGLEHHGPVATPSDNVFGNPEDFEGDSGDCYDGIPGYPKGNPGKAPELMYVEDSAWTTVEKVNYKKE